MDISAGSVIVGILLGTVFIAVVLYLGVKAVYYFEGKNNISSLKAKQTKHIDARFDELEKLIKDK